MVESLKTLMIGKVECDYEEKEIPKMKCRLFQGYQNIAFAVESNCWLCSYLQEIVKQLLGPSRYQFRLIKLHRDKIVSDLSACMDELKQMAESIRSKEKTRKSEEGEKRQKAKIKAQSPKGVVDYTGALERFQNYIKENDPKEDFPIANKDDPWDRGKQIQKILCDVPIILQLHPTFWEDSSFLIWQLWRLHGNYTRIYRQNWEIFQTSPIDEPWKELNKADGLLVSRVAKKIKSRIPKFKEVGGVELLRKISGDTDAKNFDEFKISLATSRDLFNLILWMERLLSLEISPSRGERFIDWKWRFSTVENSVNNLKYDIDRLLNPTILYKSSLEKSLRRSLYKSLEGVMTCTFISPTSRFPLGLFGLTPGLIIQEHLTEDHLRVIWPPQGGRPRQWALNLLIYELSGLISDADIIRLRVLKENPYQRIVGIKKTVTKWIGAAWPIYQSYFYPGPPTNFT